MSHPVFRRFALILAAATLATPALAGSPDAQGARIVRIADGAQARCIDASRDRISLHLRRFVIQKEAGWFTEDREVGLLLSTTLAGVAEDEAARVTFPRMFRTSVEPYREGMVQLPVEKRLFHYFPLSSPTANFYSVDLSFSVLKKKKPTGFGAALRHLASITENLPVPVNPFSDSFRFFAQYSNAVIDESLNEDNNVEAQLAEGELALSFSPDGQCHGDLEQTGTLAVIKGAPGTVDQGIVQLDEDYCWNARLKPSFELFFARPGASGSCDAIEDWIPVRNGYYAFFLNAIRSPAKPRPVVVSDLSLERPDPRPRRPAAEPRPRRSDRAEALARCTAHGLSERNCL